MNDLCMITTTYWHLLHELFLFHVATLNNSNICVEKNVCNK